MGLGRMLHVISHKDENQHTFLQPFVCSAKSFQRLRRVAVSDGCCSGETSQTPESVCSTEKEKLTYRPDS